MFRANFCPSSVAQDWGFFYNIWCKKTSVLRYWRWAKVCPKHFELILEINKSVIVASRWFLYCLTYIDDARSNTNQFQCKVRGFNETWIFSTDLRKIIQCQISWKTVRCEPSYCMRTDRHGEVSSHFSQLCECAQKGVLYANRCIDHLQFLVWTLNNIIAFRLRVCILPALYWTGLAPNLDEHCTTDISLLKLFSGVNTFRWYWLRAVVHLRRMSAWM